MVALNTSASCGRKSECEKSQRSNFFPLQGVKKFGHRKCKRSSSAIDVIKTTIKYLLLLFIEVWLSLVERCVRDAEAAGSSPVTSTIFYLNEGIAQLVRVPA